MNRVTQVILVAALLAPGAGIASADVITFDDAWASLGDGSSPATFYSAEGVTIAGSNAGVWGGDSNGNPGGWQLEGTNGPAFLGCNSGNSCSPTFDFAAPVDDFSVDIGLANDWSADFTVSGYLAGVLVGSDTSAFTDPGTTGGTWKTFTLTGPVDQVVITSTFTTGFAFGTDNAQFAAAAPEPASISMLLFGAAAIGLVSLSRLRRNGQRSAL